LQVAVKAIRKDKMDESNMKHLRREMEIMASIQHENIIQIYEGGLCSLDKHGGGHACCLLVAAIVSPVITNVYRQALICRWFFIAV